MLDMRRSESKVILTGVSKSLEKISVVQRTSGLNETGDKLIKEHFLFCCQKPNQSVVITIYLQADPAVARFYERRNVAWDTKIFIMIPAVTKREIPINRR